jgi:hypothetical protein
MIGGPMGMQLTPMDMDEMTPSESEDGVDVKEAVLALVSPFEGGGHYVLDAVKGVAGRIGAEVMTLDLTLALGFDGVAAPLSGGGEFVCSTHLIITGFTAPEIPSSLNPLLQTSPKPSPPSPSPFGGNMMEDDANEDGDEDSESQPRGATFVMPIPGRVMGLQGLNPGVFGGSPAKGSVRDDWVTFFDKLLRGQEEDLDGVKANRRIIVLSGVEAMSETFDVWWPSFIQAVRQFRAGPTPVTGGRKNLKSPPPPPVLTQPTSIIFNSSPSLLLSHTGPAMSFNKEDAEETPEKSLHPMLQALAERFGGTVEARIDEGETVPLWWGSEELDEAGREQREQRRLSTMLEHDKGYVPDHSHADLQGAGSSADIRF